MSLRLYFAVLCLFFGAIVGAAMVHWDWLPWRTLMLAKTTVEELADNHQAYRGIAPVNQREPSRYDGAGVTLADPARMAPGHTLLAGVNGNAVELWLVTAEGETLRNWRPPTTEILADATHIEGVEMPFNDFFVTLHGAALLADGGVIFTIADYTVVKMGACGEVEWNVPHMGHHSIFVAEDTGNYWAASRHYRSEQVEGEPFSAPYWEDTVIELTPDGTFLREISIPDMLIANDLLGKLYGGQRPEPITDGDFTHLNDVEILSEALAPAFPDFEAGDVMVSLRNPNLVVVFDPNTLEARWSQAGPWVRQHDPDFAEDGRIAVFDNRNGGEGGALLGGSRVGLMDPTSPTGGTWETFYANSPETPFFTAKRGMLDLLENGNILITESEGGRVIEVTPGGDIVWEYINRFDPDHVSPVMHAERYPVDHTGDAYASCG